MATCRASSEGDKKRPKRNSMREETIEELKANYEKIAMDKRTPVPTSDRARPNWDRYVSKKPRKQSSPDAHEQFDCRGKKLETLGGVA